MLCFTSITCLIAFTAQDDLQLPPQTDDALPPALVSFLKPGMRVTLDPRDDEGHLKVRVRNPLLCQMDDDAKEMDFSELSAKYPQLQEAVHSRGRIKEGSKPVWGGGSTHTVVHVGAQYVLLEANGPGFPVKSAISTARISRIDWGHIDLDPIFFVEE